jgi:hypothetical protein
MATPKDTEKQFNEVDYDMNSDHTWSKAKIDEFKNALAQSYGVLPAEITHKFDAIKDTTDEDRKNCIFLFYYMKRDIAIGGQTVLSDTDRLIYRVKMPITEDLKKIALARLSGKTTFNAAPALRPISLLPTKADAPINVIRPKRTHAALPPSSN